MTMAWGGLLLGLAGSMHCVLMCGPLVTLVAPRGSQAVLHHGSRIALYALLGAATGSIGSAAVSAGAGRILAIAAALTLLVHAFLRVPASQGLVWRMSAPLAAAMRMLQRIRERHRVLAAVGIGVVNGLLPCGMVYAALVASMGLGGPMEGAAFMAAFGAGTVPALGLVSGVARSAVLRVPALRQFAPAVLVLIAILIAFRGWPAPLPVHSH